MSKGCPCGMTSKCCDNPNIGNTDHTCNDSCESVCEESYALECKNCGDICYHEL